MLLFGILKLKCNHISQSTSSLSNPSPVKGEMKGADLIGEEDQYRDDLSNSKDIWEKAIRIHIFT